MLDAPRATWARHADLLDGRSAEDFLPADWVPTWGDLAGDGAVAVATEFALPGASPVFSVNTLGELVASSIDTVGAVVASSFATQNGAFQASSAGEVVAATVTATGEIAADTVRVSGAAVGCDANNRGAIKYDGAFWGCTETG